MVTEVDKEWGREIWMANTAQYCGKQLILNKGKRCSLHHHQEKDETFYVSHGTVLMEYGNEKRVMGKGQAVRIKPGTNHRFSGLETSVIIEISTHHEDSDSYRVQGELSGDIPEEVKAEYPQHFAA